VSLTSLSVTVVFESDNRVRAAMKEWGGLVVGM
jgi:hypothetical protein